MSLGKLEFESALAGRSVLVTGHTGFTGGWLVNWLAQLGCRITGLALPPDTVPNLFTVANVADHVASHIGDIRDPACVERAFKESQPSVVFHLAAQPLVSRSFVDPIESFSTNVMGTAHVLEAARHSTGCQAVVCVTTDKVYADMRWRWGYRENDVLGGKDPYSASKACAELVAKCYVDSLAARGNGVRVATARGGNIIGGGDWSRDRIVPDFVRACVSGGALELRNPKSVRPWQHVLALAHGYMALAERLLAEPPPTSRTRNLGPASGDVHSVEALVERLGREWKQPRTRIVDRGFPETDVLLLDSANAKNFLGWDAPLGFAETAQLTAAWFRRYHEDPGQAAAITAEQIAAYRDLLLAKQSAEKRDTVVVSASHQARI